MCTYVLCANMSEWTEARVCVCVRVRERVYEARLYCGIIAVNFSVQSDH